VVTCVGLPPLDSAAAMTRVNSFSVTPEYEARFNTLPALQKNVNLKVVQYLLDSAAAPEVSVMDRSGAAVYCCVVLTPTAGGAETQQEQGFQGI